MWTVNPKRFITTLFCAFVPRMSETQSLKNDPTPGTLYWISMAKFYPESRGNWQWTESSPTSIPTLSTEKVSTGKKSKCLKQPQCLFYNTVCYCSFNLIEATSWQTLSIKYFWHMNTLCSSFSAAAAVNHHQALCQREGDVEGRFHQQCPGQDRGGVVRQGSYTTVLPSQEVSRKYQNWWLFLIYLIHFNLFSICLCQPQGSWCSEPQVLLLGPPWPLSGNSYHHDLQTKVKVVSYKFHVGLSEAYPAYLFEYKRKLFLWQGTTINQCF